MDSLPPQADDLVKVGGHSRNLTMTSIGASLKSPTAMDKQQAPRQQQSRVMRKSLAAAQRCFN